MKPKHLFSAAVAGVLLAGWFKGKGEVSPSGPGPDPATL